MARVWSQLPSELAQRIACFMEPNEVVCNLRLVNRAAAEQFRGPSCTVVRLSQPVPPHAFQRRFNTPGATRGMPRRKRLKLLCLTAATGIIVNLEVALQAAGCLPANEVFGAAAAAGQREVIEWLWQRGYRAGLLGPLPLEAAAEAGQWDMCCWLIGKCEISSDKAAKTLEAAARGGHPELMERLLRQYPQHFSAPADLFGALALLSSMAKGCDLATLQRLHHDWLEVPGAVSVGGHVGAADAAAAEWDEYRKALPLANAVSSPTPDWRAKVEWLEGKGYRRNSLTCREVGYQPDAVERTRWLRERGYSWHEHAMGNAASAGNLAALQFWHEGAAVLPEDVAIMAAIGGHLAVFEWLVDTLGTQLDHVTFYHAADSGNLQLLKWLHARGCPWSGVGHGAERTFEFAAIAGNEEAVEWLAELGCCPLEVEYCRPYVRACFHGDMAMIRCLARLGCPWGPAGSVLKDVLRYVRDGYVHWAILPALLDAGCPVGCPEAEAALREAEGDSEDVRMVLEMLGGL